MTHLDLFTGIGGFHLAAEWAGFQTIGFSEIEPYCCKLLAQKWPDIKNYGDLRTADWGELANKVDVLSGGFPCQPWSQSGRRRGETDDRHLWPAMLTVISTVRPAWIVGENVLGIISMGQLDRCCADLEHIGYTTQPFVVPAAAVGAPHLRNRTFIVANSASAGLIRILSQSGEFASDGTNSAVRSQAELRPEIRHTNRTIYPWEQDPAELIRMANGFSNWSHRVAGLGNSVCAAQAYPFFQAIAQTERELNHE